MAISKWVVRDILTIRFLQYLLNGTIGGFQRSYQGWTAILTKDFWQELDWPNNQYHLYWRAHWIQQPCHLAREPSVFGKNVLHSLCDESFIDNHPQKVEFPWNLVSDHVSHFLDLSNECLYWQHYLFTRLLMRLHTVHWEDQHTTTAQLIQPSLK